MNLPDNVTREELFAMVVWLARYQDKLNDLRHSIIDQSVKNRIAGLADNTLNRVMMDWPIVQGSQNQIWLKRIGELEFDNAACGRALAELGSHATVEAFRKSTGEEKPTWQERFTGLEGHRWELLQNERSYATVYLNGIWFTWDKNGTGGENDKSASVEQAKHDAWDACKRQGFFTGEKP